MLPYNNIPDWLRRWKCPAMDNFRGKDQEERDKMLQEDLQKYGPELAPFKLHGDIFCVHENKVPLARTSDPGTFCTFEEAMSLINSNPKYGLGIGMFSYLCGIDIDHAVQPDGTFSQTAQDIIYYFDGAYMEYSFSGTGVHILFLCKEQRAYVKYYTKMGAAQLLPKGITDIGGLEFYQGTVDNRYLTLTGNIIPQKHPQNYTKPAKEVLAFLDKYFLKPPVKAAVTLPTSSDEEDKAWFNWGRANQFPSVLKMFEQAKKTPTGSGGTESEDDFALLSSIGFWCNGNANIMRQAFECTPYFKKKDADHIAKWNRSYSTRTINNVRSRLTGIAKLYFNDYHYDGKEIVRNDD